MVRDGYLNQRSHPAAALYPFLVTVSDVQGLSYYSDHSICKRLTMDNCILSDSRVELIQLSLIAYNKPLYHVLDLAPQEIIFLRNNPEDAMLIFAILDRLLHHAETVVIEGKSFRMKDAIES